MSSHSVARRQRELERWAQDLSLSHVMQTVAARSLTSDEAAGEAIYEALKGMVSLGLTVDKWCCIELYKMGQKAADDVTQRENF